MARIWVAIILLVGIYVNLFGLWLYRKPSEATKWTRFQRWVGQFEFSPETLGGFSYARLAVVSLFGLFLELLMIRWVSSEITIFAYFKNFVLVAMLFRLRAWLLSIEAPDQPARAMRSADRARVAVRASLSQPARYSAAARRRYRRHLAGGLLGRTVDAPQSPDPWRGLYRLALRGVRFRRGCSRVYSDRPTGRLATRKRDRRHLRLYRECPCQLDGNCSVHPALFRISASRDLVRSRWRARGIFSVASAESAMARIGDVSVSVWF